MAVPHKMNALDGGAHTPQSWAVVSDRVLISLTQSGPISDARWKQFLDDFRSSGVQYVLGTSVGSVDVNSVQRKSVAELLKGKRIAVVTDHRIARGIVTALGWLGLDIKSFDWPSLIAATDRDIASTARQAIGFLRVLRVVASRRGDLLDRRRGFGERRRLALRVLRELLRAGADFRGNAHRVGRTLANRRDRASEPIDHCAASMRQLSDLAAGGDLDGDREIIGRNSIEVGRQIDQRARHLRSHDQRHHDHQQRAEGGHEP